MSLIADTASLLREARHAPNIFISWFVRNGTARFQVDNLRREKQSKRQVLFFVFIFLGGAI
ncbi:hypothetical protein IL59_0208450 [Brucella suis bv. 4 str. 40]|nr:hypothetical protein IL59_0208450 [Brucella suis bv. 4 str. 40]